MLGREISHNRGNDTDSNYVAITVDQPENYHTIRNTHAHRRDYAEKIDRVKNLTKGEALKKLERILLNICKLERQLKNTPPSRAIQVENDLEYYNSMVPGYASLAGLTEKDAAAEAYLVQQYTDRSEGRIVKPKRENLFQCLLNTRPRLTNAETILKKIKDAYMGAPINLNTITFDFGWCGFGLGIMGLTVPRALGKQDDIGWNREWPLFNAAGSIPRLLYNATEVGRSLSLIPSMKKFIEDVESRLTERHRQYSRDTADTPKSHYIEGQPGGPFRLNFDAIREKIEQLEKKDSLPREMQEEKEVLQQLILAKTIIGSKETSVGKNVAEFLFDASASSAFLRGGLEKEGANLSRFGPYIAFGFLGFTIKRLYMETKEYLLMKKARNVNAATSQQAVDISKECTNRNDFREALYSITRGEMPPPQVWTNEEAYQNDFDRVIQKTKSDFDRIHRQVLPGKEFEEVCKIFQNNLLSLSKDKATSEINNSLWKFVDLEGRQKWERQLEISSRYVANNVQKLLQENFPGKLEAVEFLLNSGKSDQLSGFTDSKGNTFGVDDMVLIAAQLASISTQLSIIGLSSVKGKLREIVSQVKDEREKSAEAERLGLQSSSNEASLYTALQEEVYGCLKNPRSTFS